MWYKCDREGNFARECWAECKNVKKNLKKDKYKENDSDYIEEGDDEKSFAFIAQYIVPATTIDGKSDK